MAARGVFGRLMAVEARLVTSQVRFRDPTHWLFTRDRGGGGILHWLGCHFLDLLRYVLQDEVREVAAMTATLNGFPIEVEDTAALVLRWESGAVGTFAAGYHLPRSVAGYSGATYDNLIAARGEAGRFEWRPTRDREILTVESIHPDWATAPERELRFDLEPSQAYGGAYGLEFLHRFLDDARSGRPQLAGAGDALAVLQIIEAAYRSAQTGRAQPVQYD
jgi:predicted dehydrogenase